MMDSSNVRTGSYTCSPFWERPGIVGAVYHLVGRGLNDREIATELALTDRRTGSCVSSLLCLLNLEDRGDLFVHALAAARTFRQGHELAQAQPPAVAGVGELYCPDCKDLHRVLASATTKYAMACSAPFHRVSTESAAKARVDMERVKNDLQEHQWVCNAATRPPSVPLSRRLGA